jgi:hypothetical protein
MGWGESTAFDRRAVCATRCNIPATGTKERYMFFPGKFTDVWIRRIASRDLADKNASIGGLSANFALQ